MKIQLIVSDKDTETLKFKEGMTITKIVCDYSKEPSKCHLTLTCQTPPSEIDQVKANISEVEASLEKARKNNDPVGILQFSCRKVELEGELEKLIDKEI